MYDDGAIIPQMEIVQPTAHRKKIPQHEGKSGKSPFRLPDYYLHFLHDEDDLNATGLLFFFSNCSYIVS